MTGMGSTLAAIFQVDVNYKWCSQAATKSSAAAVSRSQQEAQLMVILKSSLCQPVLPILVP